MSMFRKVLPPRQTNSGSRCWLARCALGLFVAAASATALEGVAYRWTQCPGDIATVLRYYCTAVDGSGNVYVTGQLDGTVDFDPGPGVAELAATGGVFVLRLNADGSFAWGRVLAGTESDGWWPCIGSNSIAVDPQGNIVITGDYANTVDFSLGEGTDLRTAGGDGFDAFVTKLTPSGTPVWTRTLDNSDGYGARVVCDATGSVAVTGNFHGTVDFDPGSGTDLHTTTGSESGYGSFLLKLDSDGNHVWARTWDRISGEQPAALATDTTGRLYVGNYFKFSGGDVHVTQYNSDGSPGWQKAVGATYGITGIVALPEGGLTVLMDGDDCWAEKRDANGELVWRKSVSPSGSGYCYCEGQDLVRASSGNLFFGMVVDDGAGMVVGQLDADGVLLGTHDLGSGEWGLGLAAGNNGVLALAGPFEGGIDYDPTAAVDQRTGTHYLFVTKWTESGGTPPDTVAPAIVVDPSEIELDVGSALASLLDGVAATDDVDGDLTAAIVVGGDAVDTSQPGTYEVTYNVTDAAGNPAVEAKRTYRVLGFLITAEAGANGTVAPTNAAVAPGGSLAFEATPALYYAVAQWSVDGTVSQTGGTSFTLADITANHDVRVTFEMPDRDSDGMPDGWEDAYGDLQPNGDGDEDGIPNIVEYQESLNPTVADNDRDYLVLWSGWNMVALPTLGRRQTVKDLLGDQVQGTVWMWDAVSMAYRDANGEVIDPKRGLWVYVGQTCGIRLQ